MESRKSEDVMQKSKEENWESKIARFIKGKRDNSQKNTIHCSNYSSMTCLKCDKCWGNSIK
jgi:hypothetical protein